MKKKGCPKTGGRKKGTPNKVSSDVKTWISETLESERENFIEKLHLLPPQDYIKAVIALIGYVVPKPQQEASNEETIIAPIYNWGQIREITDGE